MKYYEICFKPLQALHPLYIGSRAPLEPNTFATGSIIPSTWTLTGAALNAISMNSSFSKDELIKMISNNELTFSGPYLLDESSWRAQDPNKQRIVIVPLQGIPDLAQDRESTSPYFEIIPARKVPVKGLWLAAIRIRKGEASIVSYMDPEATFTERIGIKLSKTDNTFTKTVEEGMIYSYRALEDLQARSDRISLNRPLYCTIFSLPAELDGTPVSGIIDLGGKHGIAKYMIRETSSDPFLHLSRLGCSLKEPILAVSHIPLIKISDNPTVLTYNKCKVEAVLGKIQVLYGWDYKNNTIKGPTLTITPGSFLKINNVIEEKILDKWYYRVLDTVVRINIKT